MKYHCCDLRRLEVIRIDGSANGIEFLEVLDLAAPSGVPRQRTLFVRLLRAPAPLTLTRDNIRITGGERIGEISILWCDMADKPPPFAEPDLVDGVDVPSLTLVIRTDGSGDFSTYTLGLVGSSGSDQPPGGFDPILSEIDFSFKVECPSDFDCAAALVCPPDAPLRPDIDYLAKDYQGLTPPDARPAEPARRRDGPSGRPPISASRWSSCSPMRPTTSPTGRTRSPTRPISPPRASACRCGGMRGWSTTRCTTAATRAPSSISKWRLARSSPYRREPSSSAAWQISAIPPPSRPAAASWTTPSPRGRWCSRPRLPPRSTAGSTASTSTPGATRRAACPGAPPAPRCGDTIPCSSRTGSSPTRSWFSRNGSARPRCRRRIATSPIAGRSG